MFTPLMLEKLSDYEGNEYVSEVGDNSNNDLSHTVHVDILEYQFQKMNINHLKDNFRKRQKLCMVQNILDERLVTALK